jgi:hypothetical protein
LNILLVFKINNYIFASSFFFFIFILVSVHVKVIASLQLLLCSTYCGPFTATWANFFYTPFFFQYSMICKFCDFCNKLTMTLKIYCFISDFTLHFLFLDETTVLLRRNAEDKKKDHPGISILTFHNSRSLFRDFQDPWSGIWNYTITELKYLNDLFFLISPFLLSSTMALMVNL